MLTHRNKRSPASNLDLVINTLNLGLITRKPDQGTRPSIDIMGNAHNNSLKFLCQLGM